MFPESVEAGFRSLLKIRPHAASDADIQICHCLRINNIQHNHLWIEGKLIYGDATQVVKVTQM